MNTTATCRSTLIVTVNKNFEGRAAAKETLENKNQAIKKDNQRFLDEAKSVAKQAPKAENTALLARALQPSWEAQKVPTVCAALQTADDAITVPPPGYESQAASFWINMHRLATVQAEFTAGGFKSRAAVRANIK